MPSIRARIGGLSHAILSLSHQILAAASTCIAVQSCHREVHVKSCDCGQGTHMYVHSSALSAQTRTVTLPSSLSFTMPVGADIADLWRCIWVRGPPVLQVAVRHCQQVTCWCPCATGTNSISFLAATCARSWTNAQCHPVNL